MARYNLSDVTFVIPDGPHDPIRAENRDTVIAYLNKWFNTRILVVDKEKVRSWGQPTRFSYNYYQNLAFVRIETPFVCNADCDCVFEVQAYIDAYEALKSDDQAVFSFPHDGQFYSLAGKTRQQFIDTLDLSGISILTAEPGRHAMGHGGSVGRPFFAPMDKYRAIGFENPFFLYWGHEDHERLVRARKLGFTTISQPYTLWHMDHPERGGEFFEGSNQAHYQRMRDITKKALAREVRLWVEMLDATLQPTWPGSLAGQEFI